MMEGFRFGENLFIDSQEAKTLCDFTRPLAKKPRLDRKIENREKIRENSVG